MDGATGGAAAVFGGTGFDAIGLTKAGLSGFGAGVETADGVAANGGGIGAVATGSSLAAAQAGADSSPTSAAVRSSPKRLAMYVIHRLTRTRYGAQP